MARGLLVDFGGVLTTSVFASFAAFCDAEGLRPDAVEECLRGNRAARALLVDFEIGRISTAEFERGFATVLGVRPHGLVRRLLRGARPDPAMTSAVRAARAAGVRTALVSNSWGVDGYDRDLLAELFDTAVISGEIGVRKPDPRIYALAVERLGVPAEQCVFVDDIRANLMPAAALGMATILHRDARDTVRRLEELLGVALTADGQPGGAGEHVRG